MNRRSFLTVAGTTCLGAGLATVTEGVPAWAVTANYFNRRIPDEAHIKMGQLASQGITSFSFTPSNGWVMATELGGYFARGIPDECYTTLGQMLARRTRIHSIAFPPAGGNRWVITGNNDYFARNIEPECYQTIVNFYRASEPVVHVAFPPGGGNRWVVVGTRTFFARNIDEECYQAMLRLTQQSDRRVTRVAFPYSGGWAAGQRQDHFG
jgi:hypothetical protein